MKKKKNKVVFIVTVVSGIATILNIAYIFLLPLLLSYLFQKDLSGANSIGIIGGADGPTSIYVGSSYNSHLITVILALITILGIAYLIISKRKIAK
ncbi:MAG: sodium ion-translocating decarboxylase subunit beta [Mobilitalea sp.]